MYGKLKPPLHVRTRDAYRNSVITKLGPFQRILNVFHRYHVESEFRRRPGGAFLQMALFTLINSFLHSKNLRETTTPVRSLNE